MARQLKPGDRVCIKGIPVYKGSVCKIHQSTKHPLYYRVLFDDDTVSFHLRNDLCKLRRVVKGKKLENTLVDEYTKKLTIWDLNTHGHMTPLDNQDVDNTSAPLPLSHAAFSPSPGKALTVATYAAIGLLVVFVMMFVKTQ